MVVKSEYEYLFNLLGRDEKILDIDTALLVSTAYRVLVDGDSDELTIKESVLVLVSALSGCKYHWGQDFTKFLPIINKLKDEYPDILGEKLTISGILQNKTKQSVQNPPANENTPSIPKTPEPKIVELKETPVEDKTGVDKMEFDKMEVDKMEVDTNQQAIDNFREDWKDVTSITSAERYVKKLLSALDFSTYRPDVVESFIYIIHSTSSRHTMYNTFSTNLDEGTKKNTELYNFIVKAYWRYLQDLSSGKREIRFD